MAKAYRSWDHSLTAIEPTPWCSWPACREAATFQAFFRYVTGRKGRVSSREPRYCTKHAARFAHKHGLRVVTIPVMPEGPLTVSERP